MVGFAYAVMGMKNQRPMQWSHMTGVLPEFRGGLGYRLKLAQRERALSQGLDLIEWTFDPLQAMNAHFNFAKLGGVSEEYAVNFYGESTSALHRGTPTDRLVLSWRIAEPHVIRRLEQAGSLRARAHDVSEAPIVNPTELDGSVAAGDVDRSLARRSPRVDRDSNRIHRDAAAGTRPRAAVAHGSAADVRGVFRSRVSRRGFCAAAGRRASDGTCWPGS